MSSTPENKGGNNSVITCIFPFALSFLLFLPLMPVMPAIPLRGLNMLLMKTNRDCLREDRLVSVEIRAFDDQWFEISVP